MITTYKMVDPAEAVTLILNDFVAYQTMHRSAKVNAGDTVLIMCAGGGLVIILNYFYFQT